MKKQFFTILILIISFGIFASAIPEHIENNNLRIVSLSPNVTQIVFALGSGQNLVGRSDYCNDPVQAKDIQSVGSLYDPNLELIISLNPDVVIASSITDPSLIDKLNKAGIKSYQFLEEYNGMEGTFNLIQSVGDAIDKHAEALEIIKNQKEELKRIENQLSSLEKKSCAIIIGWGEYGSWGATGDTFLNDVIECAHGENIASYSRFWSVSDELLLSSDPDFIFITPDSNAIPPEEILEAFMSYAPYNRLKASRNKNVYLLDSDYCQKQGIRTIEAVKIIASTMYQEVR